MKRELEELEAIRMREMLVCYQKTRNGVVKKADIAKPSSSKVEDMRSTLDSFKHDIDDNLPRQVKSMVKEVLGNTQGKQMADTTSISMA
jgi:hypothetical protein